jgi:hypothetical protein
MAWPSSGWNDVRMDDPTECLVCAEPLEREQVEFGTWQGTITKPGRLYCPSGHTETVEYTRLLEQWRAQRGG